MGSPNPISTPLPAIAQNVSARSKAKLQAAARDFESLFVGYMLKSMRETTSTDEMFGESYGGDMLEGLFDTEFSKQMSKNSSLGIAQMLYKKMTGESLTSQSPIVRTPKDVLPVRSSIDIPSPVSPPKGTPEKTSGVVVPAPADVVPSVSLPAGEQEKPHNTSISASPTQPLPTQRRRDGIDQRMIPYQPAILEAAEKHSLDPNLIRAVIATESGGNVNARSPKNAKGLMQLVDSTAADMGVHNVWDPKENIFAGAKYLQQLLTRFDGNIDTAIASYNAGPGAVEKHGGIPPFKETRAYVQRVKNYIQYFKQLEGDGNDDE